MSIRPFIIWLAALIAVVGMTGTASAQKYLPFVDPGYFGQVDFQFFAPAEVGDFGGEEPPNTGVYFDYDRTYVNVGRPDNTSFGSGRDGDFTWGNRYEIGYMTEDHTGWGAVLWHLSGPNEYVDHWQERLDRFNDDDEDPASPDPIIQNRNPRTYFMRDSLNVASLSSFELNKTWRRKEFHDGSILEPLVGFRYIKFKDFTRRENYERFPEDILGEPILPPPETVDGTFERLTQDTAVFENSMIGGQLGLRYFRQRGHWLLSTDVKFFAMANFQQVYNQQDVRMTRYSAVSAAADPDPELELFDRFREYDENEEFVWGGEVRAEAAYELTRDISIRFGMVFLDLGQGIGRGTNPLDNNQDVQIAGVTFGLTVNR